MKEDSEKKPGIARGPSGQRTRAVLSSSAALPGVLSIARALINQELQSGPSTDTIGRAAFRVCEKLRQPLSSLIGAAGFRSLFSRALTMAKREFSWLAGLEVGPEGIILFSTEMTVDLDGGEAALGGTALIAQLLGLLVTFIGETLTLRLVNTIWPARPITNSKSKGEQS